MSGRYHGSEPAIVHFDDLLSAETLAKLQASAAHSDGMAHTQLLLVQAYLEDSTIFYDVKAGVHTHTAGCALCDTAAGYLGTYLRDGFDPPILMQIASELRERLPSIFGEHPLHQVGSSQLFVYASSERFAGVGLQVQL